MVILVIILILIVLVCFMQILSLAKKVKEYIQANKGITTLNVLQEFMKVMGQDINTSQKINKLNEILIKGYDLEYSSIVMFDGVTYAVKASNVATEKWDYLSMLHTEQEFIESISTTEPKTLKAENEESTLKYSSAIQRNIKNAKFFPLYIDNVYIGYWIIESEKVNAFDSVEEETLNIIKSNIASIIQGMSYQDAIESMVMTDKFTGLNSRDYLYGEGKAILNKHVISSVVLFEMTNIMDVNETIGREAGNKCMTEISDRMKEYLPDTSIFVRYMGPKFAVAFPGSQIEDLQNVFVEMKKTLESKKVKVRARTSTELKINLVAGTYYKGTGLDSLIRKLEDKLVETTSENTITVI